MENIGTQKLHRVIVKLQKVCIIKNKKNQSYYFDSLASQPRGTLQLVECSVGHFHPSFKDMNNS